MGEAAVEPNDALGDVRGDTGDEDLKELMLIGELGEEDLNKLGSCC